MKILVLVDRLDWAYYSIALGLLKYGGKKFDVEPIKGNAKRIKKIHKQYDRFLVMGWQCWKDVDFLPKSETLVGVHGHHAWDGRQTTPEKDVNPPQKLHDLLQSFKGVNCVSKRLKNLFPYAVYTPNGVDVETFRRETIPGQKGFITVGCAYNPKSDWRKGVKEFIEPAVKKAGYRLLLAPNNRKLYEMPAYYNLIDVYVCASSSEGMSLSILEAMACGRPVISTWPLEQERCWRCNRDVFDITTTLLITKRDMESQSNLVLDESYYWGWNRVAKSWTDWVAQ